MRLYKISRNNSGVINQSRIFSTTQHQKDNLSFEKISEDIQSCTQDRVKLAAIDIDGIARGKYVEKSKLNSISSNGLSFCSVVFGWDSQDVLYDNAKAVGWHTGYGDFPCKIDLATYRRVPWEEGGMPFFLMDFQNSKTGKGLEFCPRTLLKSVVEQNMQAGFRPLAGFEYEWFNFKETPQSLVEKKFTNLQPLTPGMFGYSVLRAGQNKDYISAIVRNMNAFKIPIEAIHTETGPGIYEAAIRYSDAVEAADRAALFKMGTKEIAHAFGIIPCFMARPSSSLPGNGGHIHINLSDHTTKNLFLDESDPNKMSSLFKHFIAGQLHCLPHILPMLAPTVNSYKRLVAGYWAPVKPTWAVENRTSSFRVIPAGKATRMEARVCGADANPYLALAASLASGLYGIKKGLSLEKPTDGSSYSTSDGLLPRNLGDAAQKMASSELAKELFGEAFVDHFVSTRIWEWRQFQSSVTNWELERYMEII